MALLTPDGQASIKIRENAYQWIDPLTDEIVVDGCSLLNEALKLMRPDVQMNVYAELAKIKSIKPKSWWTAVRFSTKFSNSCVLMFRRMFMLNSLKSSPSNLSITVTMLSNGILPWNPSALQLSKRSLDCIMNLNSSWITSMLL